MSAMYTFDVFSSLDGFGSTTGDWGGYWGKQGPELLARRLEVCGGAQRLVLGANTYRADERRYAASAEGEPSRDPWVKQMRSLPMTVVSSTLDGPLDRPNATVERGDGVEIVARLKAESEIPLRSHGSLRLNWALLAAGLVDRIQVTIFPVVTGRTGAARLFEGVPDLDLELIEARLLDGRTQELIYHPTLHT